jgi:hypothetical protein
MKKAAAILLVFAVILSLWSCKAGPQEVKKAENFMADLSALDAASPVTDISKLVEATAPVLGIRVTAFDLKDHWEEKSSEYEKYVHIFGSGGVASVYVFRGRVEKVTYTFCVNSKTDIFDAADTLVGLYGDPDAVSLNSAQSTNSDVKKAISESSDPDLRYNYQWTPNLKGQSLSLYMAYYYANGVNFAYVVVSVPDKK